MYNFSTFWLATIGSALFLLLGAAGIYQFRHADFPKPEFTQRPGQVQP